MGRQICPVQAAILLVCALMGTSGLTSILLEQARSRRERWILWDSLLHLALLKTERDFLVIQQWDMIC